MNKASDPKVHSALRLSVLEPALVQLGTTLSGFGHGHAFAGHESGSTASEHAAFEEVIAMAERHNRWFTEGNIRHALLGIGHLLEAEALRSWLAGYPELQDPLRSVRTIGLVLAGNLPLVGFHDLLCVLVSGHHARVKCSSQDDVLLPAVVEILERFLPGISGRIEFVNGKLGEVDAVIATGSNNTARYFDHYFGHIPRIVRRSRVSVAVLDGSETDTELAALGEDVFRYFGLGCRNVAKLYVPRDFTIDRFFTAIYPWKDVVNHGKYGNNYDYNRAVWLLEQLPFLENGFLLVKEDAALASPVASVHLERYDDPRKLEEDLKAHEDAIQCIVRHGHIPFGRSQFPQLSDYADGVDTIHFLTHLDQGTNS